MKKEELRKIKNICQDFFGRMTIETEVEIRDLKENTIAIEIKTEDPKILIGEGGRTLAEIQHLLRAILRKQIISEEEAATPFFLDLDIGGYKKKKHQYLKEMARSLADEVALSKKEKILPPMLSSDRRIIHLELAERTDVVTESAGKEPERKIIIRPSP